MDIDCSVSGKTEQIDLILGEKRTMKAEHVFDSDYYRMTEKQFTGFRAYVNMMLHHHILYVYCLRKYQRHPNPLLRTVLYHYTRKYGLEISPLAEIGEVIYLGHPYNITVAEGAVLGKNVNLHKGCTIGRENRGKREGVPTIGDCVSVGINATVVGKVHIGNDVLIAPNAYINFDVPDHSVVVGNPGIIHHRENATERYVGWLV